MAIRSISWYTSSPRANRTIPKWPLPPCPLISTKPSRIDIRNEVKEIRVCLNKSCRKLGSRETLELMSDLAPPEISVKSCSCLGRCGSGPNLVLLPAEEFVSHCDTPAKIADLLAIRCGAGDAAINLEALALRKRAQLELEKGNYSGAEELLTQAINIEPRGGLQSIYKSRSAARYSKGNYSGALEDAQMATKISPKCPQAYILQGDAYFGKEAYGAAENAYYTALEIDRSLRRSKPFKARIAELQEKLANVELD
ncbi:hypothetical protein AMTRI_Chr09g32530 [Amborella trichopoda]|uniref:Uncharacterized protein n=1 Tax=Amborella trichopoda TaxID=13333 RepID=W1PQI6_AMBTC|nr:uncharacterized protein LOC18437633 isoform X1 [Amborella trichopoda]ERN09480.1 hypothetical protein AMTR_s00029p00107920 [Amborella trichopoda]|eukprot:XP_006847899.1 uncharacterized protein LOC18437633 isoform X1 [Amborella trichopoda]